MYTLLWNPRNRMAPSADPLRLPRRPRACATEATEGGAPVPTKAIRLGSLSTF